MALVRRGNVELEVNDDFLKQYLAKGFDQVDNTGKIISKGMANNYPALQRAYVQLQNENKKLLEDFDKANSTIKELKSKLDAAQKKSTVKVDKVDKE